MKSFINKSALLTVGISIILCQACGDPSYVPVLKGLIEFQITDAASDDSDIKSIFLTVVDIKADGQSISGFAKQTIDITSFQAGNTKLLALTTLVSKTYHTLTLVLDAETDVNGNTPGCYVQTVDNAKYKLNNGRIEILVNADWTVTTNVQSAVIMDFDLRKSIRAIDDPSIRYNFVSTSNLNDALRVINRDRAGTMNGLYVDQSNISSDKVIVYVYRRGSYIAGTETQPQGDDKIYFKNAVTSAQVRGDGVTRPYTLAFLEEGDYELHFASYRKDNGGTHFTLQTMLAGQSTIGGTLVEIITMKRAENVSVSSVITGGI